MVLGILERMAILYLVIINFAAFFMMRSDKKRAKNKLWRISEKYLFLAAAAGGSAGAMAGMRMYRHKTKHIGFVIGLPFLFVLQCFVLLWIIFR